MIERQMMQVMLNAPKTIVMIKKPIPKPKDKEVLIKIAATGICSTDIHSYLGETIHGNIFPFHIGHEIAGFIVDKGEAVNNLNIGQNVIIDPLVTCGKCFACLKGDTNRCENVHPLGIYGPGGFSNYTIIDSRNVYPFKNDNYLEMTFAEPLATTLNGISKINITSDKNILIQGAGTMGLLFLQVLKKIMDVSHVFVGDILKRRLNIADDFDAIPLIMPISNNHKHKFDIIIDCTGNTKSVQDDLALLADGGTLLIFGVCPQNQRIEISPFEVYRREIEIIGSFSLKKNNISEAVSILDSNQIDVKPLISGVIPLCKLEETMKGLSEGKLNGKYIVSQLI